MASLASRFWGIFVRNKAVHTGCKNVRQTTKTWEDETWIFRSFRFCNTLKIVFPVFYHLHFFLRNNTFCIRLKVKIRRSIADVFSRRNCIYYVSQVHYSKSKNVKMQFCINLNFWQRTSKKLQNLNDLPSTV